MTEQEYKGLKKGDKVYQVNSLDCENIKVVEYTFIRYQNKEECKCCGDIKANNPLMVLRIGKKQILADWHTSLFISLKQAIEREIYCNELLIKDTEKANNKLHQMIGEIGERR